MLRHEIDRFGRGFLGRHNQIALVLTIGVVSHDHNASAGDVAHHIVDRFELKSFRRLDNH